MQTVHAFANAANNLPEGDAYRDMSYAALFLALVELSNIDDYNEEHWLPEAHNEDSALARWIIGEDEDTPPPSPVERRLVVEAFEEHFRARFEGAARPLPINVYPEAIVEAIVLLNRDY